MDDCEIVKLYLERSEDAIAKTKSKYGKFCCRLAFNILKNREDSEECENEAYLKLWNAIPPQKPDALMPYLGKIIRRLSLQRYEYYTAKKRNAKLETAFCELEECIAEPRDIESQYSAEELSKAINYFLHGIDSESRKIFVRRYWYTDSIKQIAVRFEISQSKVKSSLFRTRNRLKSELMKEGLFA